MIEREEGGVLVVARLNLLTCTGPLPATFYRTATGVEPVRKWLKELSREDKRIVGKKKLPSFGFERDNVRELA